MKEEGIVGRRRFSMCGGIGSVHPERRKLTRNASFGGYNEIKNSLAGFERKEDILPLKEDSSLSLSKSRSESKLYNGSDKDVSTSANKLTKKESLKVQKKNYREEKKRATKELLSTITDPSVVVMADWLKIRGSLKSWTKLWCVLKPGVLLIYKSQKSDQWVGTVLLSACELIERPSKKNGFCFKLFHPLEQSIWATKGPKGETVGSITQPLPSSHLIFRAASESDGRCWMDALELALKCSSLLKRTMIREGKEETTEHAQINFYSLLRSHNLHESDQFKDELNSDKSDREIEQDEWEKSEESDSDTSERQEDLYADLEHDTLRETLYVEQSHEELGEAGEASQTETVSEENKSLIWTLLKQVRPGMDLSKVVLPTFILEPRSFLDKLSDYYYHADFMSEAAVEENAYNRMKKVVKWYISGFYKKPKGLKKPYNPIIGETFRCMWIHPKTNSKTFYISEQVSHHPPVSAFYVSNRKDGFCLSGSILAKSKFYGNSLSAILDGEARLTFLNRGEDYIMNMPYAHCKGILYGTMTLELAGQVTIMCEKTGYSAQLEFKLKPFLGSSDSVNQISGKIKLGKEVLATLEGHWDSEIFINDKKSGVCETFWNPTPELRQSRLTRCTVAQEEQGDFESERLWQHVTRAILNKDQTEATNEKFVLEEAQRKCARERKLKNEQWKPVLFEQDASSGDWHYRYADTRPWDPLNDLVQFEKDGRVQTKVRHRTPMVTGPKRKHKQNDKPKNPESGCSSPELDHHESSGSERQKSKPGSRVRKKVSDLCELQSAVESIKHTQDDICRSVSALRSRVEDQSFFLTQRDYIIIIFLIGLQLCLSLILK
ncbi:oxysterol-binding protein-related protein 8 isoform X9 [Ictalurus punctatus]|uniref:Oxysterol-binding protein n=1 Tax=Ictalurus punctatus TaxID=7998 RepID=A0A979FDH6_ICTPU|nr:oxysterol-binding protein-related protein 8 isoform X9 [Ictalurus punctatus]